MDAALEIADDPLIGSTVAGKYLIKSRVGGGAMGVVYEATQVALDKRVAIKVLNRELQTRLQFVGRFHVEAKAASLLDHANSTRVIDFGTDDSGLLYICMEFLEGRNLYEVVKAEWPLDPLRVADILSQTLAALAKAHEMGILHRDIKPDNIVIQRRVDDEGKESDVVKVCDFGIAKLEGVEAVALSNNAPLPSVPMMRVGSPALTNAGLIIGTPDYMSPEQARGEPLDPRSDIYSVGVVLYHMLAGRPPFDGETAADILTKHITAEPLAPSSMSNVDPELEAICQRAMSKLPENRYGTAREMRSALRRTRVFQRGHADAAPLSTDAPGSIPTTELALTLSPLAPTRTAQVDPRRPGLVVILATLALAMVATAMAFRMRWHDKPTATQSIDAGVVVAAGASTIGSSEDRTSPAVIVRAAPSASEDPIAIAPMVDPNAPHTPPTATVAAAAVAMKPGASATATATAAVSATAPAVTAPGVQPVTTAAPTAPVPPATPAPPALIPPLAPLAPGAAPITATADPRPAPPAAVAPPPPFHPENGRVEVAKIETDRVTSRSINEVIRHTNLQRCYSDALTKAGQPRAGTAAVVLDIDQNRVEHARFGDTIGLPGLGACIEGQFSHARVADADTGGASANITLHFVGP